MPVAARALRVSDAGALLGLVDAHICHKTAALCDRLLRLALTCTEGEFDLDVALQYKPALIAVDEPAHTNAPGVRNFKRRRDGHALLDAGIDVFTTVRLQDPESARSAPRPHF